VSINGLLTWIGRGFGIHHLTLHPTLRFLPYHLLPRYVVRSLLLTSLSPRLTKINVGRFAGVPRSEILRVSELLATKLVENEFAAYVEPRALMASQDALSKRGFTSRRMRCVAMRTSARLASRSRCCWRSRLHALVSLRIGPSAMMSGFISTLQAAGIAYVLFQLPSPLPSSINS
jgi:concentrative nucleoside transporter, CNT family